jgi:hypothetical protein
MSEVQDILCWVCERPLVSRSYQLGGKVLWSTIHDSCVEEANRRLDIDHPVKRKQKPKSYLAEGADQ